MRRILDKCLAEHPTAVIVNLRAADDPRASSAPLLVMAHRVGRAMLPRVPIAVCVMPGRLPVTPYLAVGPAEPAAQAPLLPPLVELSAREEEILSYLPTMLTADDIAARLHVSVNTVKAHLRSVYRRLGVSRRQEAVTEAIRSGLL